MTRQCRSFLHRSFLCDRAHSFTNFCPSCLLSATLLIRFAQNLRRWHISPQTSSFFIIKLVGLGGGGQGKHLVRSRCSEDWELIGHEGTVSFPTNCAQNKFHHYMNTRAYFDIVSCLVRFIRHQDYHTVLHRSLS